MLVYHVENSETSSTYETEHMIVGDGSDRYAVTPANMRSMKSGRDPTRYRHVFFDLGEARRHLRGTHFDEPQVQSSSWESLITSGDNCWRIEARRQGQDIIQQVLDCCQEAQRLMREISNGVCNGGDFDQEVYRKIPASFVDAFGCFVNIFRSAADDATKAHSSLTRAQRNGYLFSLLLELRDDQPEQLREVTNSFEGHIVSAEYDLMSINNAAHEKDKIEYEAIGLEAVLLQVLGGLMAAPQSVLSKDQPPLSLSDAYTKESSNMVSRYDQYQHTFTTYYKTRNFK